MPYLDKLLQLISFLESVWNNAHHRRSRRYSGKRSLLIGLYQARCHRDITSTFAFNDDGESGALVVLIISRSFAPLCDNAEVIEFLMNLLNFNQDFL